MNQSPRVDITSGPHGQVAVPTALREKLDLAAAALEDLGRAAFGDDEFSRTSDAELLQSIADLAGLARRVEGCLITAAGEVHERTASRPKEERLTVQAGCRNEAELLTRVTRASRRTATGYLKAARAFRREFLPSLGTTTPPRWPAIHEALGQGDIGADGVLAVLGPLQQASAGAGTEATQLAEAALAAAASGTDPQETSERPPPVHADQLHVMAQVWAQFLDQDGAEPRDEAAMRKRGLILGPARDGLVAIRGHLLPDVAGRLRRQLDAVLSPRTTIDDTAVSSGAGAAVALGDAGGGDEDALAATERAGAPADERSHAQKQHDAFATMLDAAAAAPDMPLLGGAPPTLVITAREEDMAAQRGHAHVDSVGEAVPACVARQIACHGAVQRITLDAGGRIASLETHGRVFNAAQRRAIMVRDGGCIIPGCDIRAEWCEIHHVREWSEGGATHTDNGVSVCWFHHRTLETSGWDIRMRSGVPEVRAPAWWDPGRRWRPTAGSLARQRELLERSTPLLARAGP